MPLGISDAGEFESFVAWFNEGRSLAQSEHVDAGIFVGTPPIWVAAAASLRSRGITSLDQPTAEQLKKLSQTES